METKPSHQLEDTTIDIKALVVKLLRNWKYYVIIGLCIGLWAYAYLKFSIPTYLVSTSILIHENSPTATEEDILLQNLHSQSNSNLDNEIALLHSFNTIEKTIESLDFEVSYYQEFVFGTIEKYRNCPFLVQLDTNAYQLKGKPIYIKPISDNEFQVSIDDMNHQQVCKFGEECASDYYQFNVQKSFDHLPSTNNDYFIVINNLNRLTEKYIKRLSIARVGPGSSLLEISLSGELPRKEINFLNRLTEVFTKENLKEKNVIAQRTIDFINSQLLEVSDSLQGAETQLQTFRSEENIMDLSFAATTASEKLAGLENEQAEIKLKLRYYDYLINYIRNNTDVNSIVAPASIGITDPLLNELIMELKGLYTDKVALDYTRGDNSYELNILNLQIENTRKAIIENVNNIIQSSQITLQDVNARIGDVTRRVNKLPENERDLVRIQRKFNLSDNLYNFLLQKRAEAGIAKASNRSDHTVVDKARIVGGSPISPKSDLVYLLASVLSFIIPTLIILIKEFANDKVMNIDQLEKLSSLPIIGKIGKKKDKFKSVAEAPLSRLAEDFRALRFNLHYVLQNRNDREVKIIGITSAVSEEGKTFCAYNLAAILAISNKKVLLIEADMRRPSFKGVNKKLSYQTGLSSYLTGSVPMNHVIQRSDIQDLDIITSGPLPPNPSELIESSMLNNLVNEIKNHYDYIIIDAPPIGLVSDYRLFSNKIVDATLYVVRLRYSTQNSVRDFQKDYQLGKYNQIALVVNDLTQDVQGKYSSYYSNNGVLKKRKKKALHV